MRHDLYAYESGSYDDHAHKGAGLARQILGELVSDGFISNECKDKKCLRRD